MWKTVILLIITIIVIPYFSFYLDESPTELQKSTLISLAWVYVASAAYCFIVSTITKNYSQVDKFWSVIPMVYAWMACHYGNYEPRLILMAVLVSIWGIRLTLNFTRRGGFTWKFWEGEEDYRWAILRAKPEFQSPIRWMIFNLLFISYYQMGLILLFTIPIVRSMDGTPLGIFDYVIAAVFILLVVMETIADQQQYDYQTEKYRRINNNEPLEGNYKKGFVDTGLWSKSRHPNYFAEQSIWIVFYLFSGIASGNWLNWSIMGCVLLVILFYNSSVFSEEISAGKYPEYKEYQKKVPRFIPFTKW